jgi:hypothetical protein
MPDVIRVRFNQNADEVDAKASSVRGDEVDAKAFSVRGVVSLDTLTLKTPNGTLNIPKGNIASLTTAAVAVTGSASSSGFGLPPGFGGPASRLGDPFGTSPSGFGTSGFGPPGFGTAPASGLPV